MGSTVKFPNKAISSPEVSPSLARPIFGGDIQNATENINEAFVALCGDPDFMIVRGLEGPDYGGTTGNYNEGIVIIFGVAYYFAGGVLLNKYLVSADDSTQLQLSKPFNDTSEHPIYRVYIAAISNTAVAGASPQFTGNMNSYRINLSKLNTAITQEITDRITDVNQEASDRSAAITSLSNTINLKALEVTANEFFGEHDNGGIYNYGGSSSHPVIEMSGGGGGGTVNYYISQPCNMLYWEVFSWATSLTTFNLKITIGEGSELLKTVAFGRQNGAKYLFIRIDELIWIEITSILQHP